MATATVNIPAASLIAPTKRGSIEELKQQVLTGINKYGQFFKTAAENSKLPIELLIAFAATESGVGSKMGPTTSPTYGIMQWNRTYAKVQLENELKAGRMTPEEKAILAKYNIKFDANGKTRAITNADQKKPELNITIGSIILGQLIDQDWGTSPSGVIHLDRVIAVYNAGAFGDTGKKARQKTSPLYDTPQKLASSVNSVTKAYINKMLGLNGAMDIASSDLKSVLV